MNEQLEYMSLFYLGSDECYNANAFANSMWTPDWYYLIRRYPAIEMEAGGHPIRTAVELIKMTNGIVWRSMYRRPIKFGDVFCLGDMIWLFAKYRDFNLFGLTQQDVKSIPALPKLIITTLPGICKGDVLCMI